MDQEAFDLSIRKFLKTVPAPSFDEPLEMLAACHERIEAQLGTLERLGPHLAERGCDAEARTAALGVIRYFDTAGANHHLDEEEDIFPALQHHAPTQATLSLIFRLRTEHKKLDTLWNDMRARLNAIAAVYEYSADEGGKAESKVGEGC